MCIFHLELIKLLLFFKRGVHFSLQIQSLGINGLSHFENKYVLLGPIYPRGFSLGTATTTPITPDKR